MSIIEQIHLDAAAKGARVILPESTDERILQAAAEVRRRGIANPVLVGRQAELNEIARQLDLDIMGIKCIDPQACASDEKLHQHLRSRKWYTELSDAELSEFLQSPLALACAQLAVGQVDACVAGAALPTSAVISHGLRIVGTRENSPLLSCFLLMVFVAPPAEGLDYALFADCAININPDSEQLAQIALSTAQSAESLFKLDPQVALLSFSTAGSANHEDADKVACAAQYLHEHHASLKVIGEAQFDSALLPSIRQAKMPNAEFNQPANVYVFPNLDAGNIGYKIAERIGNAKVIGPILQGMHKPLNDLSRGADVEAIVNTIAMTCLQVD